MIDIPNVFPDLKHAAQKLRGGRLRLAKDIQEQLIEFGLNPSLIVDLGCGPMTVAELFAENYPDANIVGCDIADHRPLTSDRSLPNLTFNLIQPFSLSERISNAELVLLIGVAHHVKPEEEDLLLRDIHSSLSDNGILVVHEHILSANSVRRRLERFLLSCVEFGINEVTEGMRCSYNFFTRDVLRDALERNGFRIDKIVDVGGRYVTLPFLNDHALLYCRKSDDRTA